jgi:hypothetical protein
MMSSPIAGYNAVLWARGDHQNIANRDKTRTEEWIWAPSRSLGMNGATFAGLLWVGYCTGIPVDMAGNDAPIMDDPTLEDYNVPSIVDAVVAAAMSQNSTRPQGNQDATVDVMFPLGCDFQYENSATWFLNTDKLIHYLNADGRVNAFYSTPSIYTRAKLQAGKTYSLDTYDEMPYSDSDHSYWSGYFVSRAALKGYVRESSSVFQAAKQVQVFAGGAPDVSPANPLYRFERSMGVLTHHDAVAGTAKQAVRARGAHVQGACECEWASTHARAPRCTHVHVATAPTRPPSATAQHRRRAPLATDDARHPPPTNPAHPLSPPHVSSPPPPRSLTTTRAASRGAARTATRSWRPRLRASRGCPTALCLSRATSPT